MAGVADDTLTRRLLVAGLRTWADQLEAGGELQSVLAGLKPGTVPGTAREDRPLPAPTRAKARARSKRKPVRAAAPSATPSEAPPVEGAPWPANPDGEGAKLAQALLASDRWAAQGFHAAVLQRWANGGHCTDASRTRMREALAASA